MSASVRWFCKKALGRALRVGEERETRVDVGEVPFHVHGADGLGGFDMGLPALLMSLGRARRPKHELLSA